MLNSSLNAVVSQSEIDWAIEVFPTCIDISCALRCISMQACKCLLGRVFSFEYWVEYTCCEDPIWWWSNLNLPALAGTGYQHGHNIIGAMKATGWLMNGNDPTSLSSTYQSDARVKRFGCSDHGITPRQLSRIRLAYRCKLFCVSERTDTTERQSKDIALVWRRRRDQQWYCKLACSNIIIENTGVKFQ